MSTPFMLRPKRSLYAPYDPNDPNLLDQGSYVTNQLGPDDPSGDPQGYGDLAMARNASSLFQPSRYPDERALASSRNAVNQLGPGQDPELEKVLSMRNVLSLFGGGKGGSSKGPSFAFNSRAPTDQEMLSAQPYDPSPDATNGRMGQRPQSSSLTKDTSQTSSMYQPAASDQPMSTDQQFDRPSEAEASMFRPDSTGPMPDWATRRPDALQQATQSLYAPAQDAGQAPQAGGAPQEQAAAPQRPQTQWEKYGIQPPKVFNPNDPEVGARLGPIDKLSMEQRRTTARYLTEQDRLRASEELKSAQLGEYHEIQKGYYKNQSRMATPYPVETPNGPEWQTHDMVTGEVHNLGPWSPKSQPPQPKADTAFDVWRQQNPKAPISDWFKIQPSTQAATIRVENQREPAGTVMTDATGTYVVDPRNATARPVTMPGGDVAPTLNRPGGASGAALTDEEVKLNADAIEAHRKPPLLNGFGRAGAGKISAELERRGFDLARATSDWNATQKYLGTLNGPQQTRFRQAIVSVPHALDLIDKLADQWDGGGFPLLNKAQLALAKNGVLGPKAQQIATQLDAQINDVVAELGQVYMGGTSPTDHALELAAKNLSADWSRNQLRALTAQSRQNIEIKRGSISEAGAMGVTPGSSYLPPTPAPTAATETPDSIKADFKAGRITRAQAKQKLEAAGIK